MQPRDFSLLGRWCRADVTYCGDSAVLTGSLAGELVAKVFAPADSAAYVFDVARELAFNGRWALRVEPRTGDTLDMLEPVVVS